MKFVVSRVSGDKIDCPILKNEKERAYCYEYDVKINTIDDLLTLAQIDHDGIIMNVRNDVCNIMIYDDYIE